jgi:hypothetical protein
MADKHKTDEKFDFVGAQGEDERGGEAAPAAGGATVPPIPDGINVMSVEVAGVYVDSRGNKWTVPEKEEVDIRYKSKFTIPRPDPLMSYQFIRKEELTEMMGEQWVPVTREEIGVANFRTEKDEYGDPLDRYHVIGTQICVKKPKVLVDRQYAAQKRVCDAAVSATEPPPTSKDPKEQAARNGAQRGQRRYNLGRKTETVVPKNPESEQLSGLE